MIDSVEIVKRVPLFFIWTFAQSQLSPKTNDERNFVTNRWSIDLRVLHLDPLKNQNKPHTKYYGARQIPIILPTKCQTKGNSHPNVYNLFN
jgi:hypothetical protein